VRSGVVAVGISQSGDERVLLHHDPAHDAARRGSDEGQPLRGFLAEPGPTNPSWARFSQPPPGTTTPSGAPRTAETLRLIPRILMTAWTLDSDQEHVEACAGQNLERTEHIDLVES
jgi:hypothetical protein